ncbi:hypothetical protein HWV00_18660 [Moritella sp. 24]|uniref:hypothetical protein n=1 Tax=Moritella sp. 24 TaxID=2746230 RepID=UPI001BAA3F76|nr:hypothetical protein [Moritella sp. 24]QUM78071.1 hypothetical protein HWV00_18660 [Moritella sp. 24]
MIETLLSQDNWEENFTLKEIVEELNNHLPDVLTLSGVESWDELNASKEVICMFLNISSGKDNQYFISKKIETIFYLVELSGDVQQDKLGIKPIYYKSKNKAKNWRNRIGHLIGSSSDNHEKATDARTKLNELYEDMAKNGR